MSTDAMEERLAELADSIRYPGTPDLSSSVRAELRVSRQRRWGVFLRPRLAGAIALAVISALAAAGLATAVLLGLPGLSIRVVPSLSPPASHQLTPELGGDLLLGQRADLGTIPGRASFAIYLPTQGALARPTVSYWSDDLAGGQLALVYGPRPGLPAPQADGVSVLVTEFAGSMERELAQKSVGPGATVEVLNVNGGLAFWIAGQAHQIVYRDGRGQVVSESMRLVQAALAWEQDGTIIRIEGRISKEEAVALSAAFSP